MVILIFLLEDCSPRLTSRLQVMSPSSFVVVVYLHFVVMFIHAQAPQPVQRVLQVVTVALLLNEQAQDLRLEVLWHL